MISHLRTASPTRLAVYLLAVFTLLRLLYATHLGLVGDEAYYWLWSKHLAASYRDKGPAIAWTIALGTQLFGDTQFGIRFFAVILSTGVGWLIFDLARRLYDERTALWCLVIALVMPILAVGAILMTIDSLSVFFWAITVILFWKVLHQDSAWTWFWMGTSIGVGFLAKFTNGIQLICIATFLIWSKEHRSLLFRRNFLILCGAFLVAITPVIWWNMQTGWIHAEALHSRSGVKSSFGIHPRELFRFVGEQIGVISPLLMAGMVVAAVGLFRYSKDLRSKFLLSQFLPLHALFLFFSLNKAGKSNWIAPSLVTGIVLTVAYWRQLVASKPAWRRGVIAAIAMSAIMTLCLHGIEFLKLPQRLNPMHRAQGWPDFAVHVQKARIENAANLLIGADYSEASLTAFYLPDQPTTYMPPAPYGDNQFTLWPNYKVTPDTRALYITEYADNISDSLKKQFSSFKMVDDFWAKQHDWPMNHFCIYLCTVDASIQQGIIQPSH